MNEIARMSAVALGRAVASGELSPTAIVDALLEQIGRHNAPINAYVQVDADGARAQAREVEARIARGERGGPLFGVPVSIKDLIEVRGLRCTYGSPFYKDHVPTEDAVLVERVRAAGLPILGKTNAPDFGALTDTRNAVYGQTRNPWDLTRSPGGSSGGAAAQVAAGLGPLAVGNDGGGSLRFPAACCGIYSIKPQFGRVPSWPRHDGWYSLNHEGPMARTVRDAAALLDVFAGPDPRDPQSLPAHGGSFLDACERPVKGLRVAFSATPGYGVVSDEVRGTCESTARALTDHGCIVEEISLGLPPAILDVYLGVVLPRLVAQFDRDLPAGYAASFDPTIQFMIQQAQAMSARDVVSAIYGASAMSELINRSFERFDLLLLPTMATPAIPAGLFAPADIDGVPVAHPLSWVFTLPFNIAGNPAANVPAGFSQNGLPIGLQIVGRRFDENTVLAASARLEESRPWADRWPTPQG